MLAAGALGLVALVVARGAGGRAFNFWIGCAWGTVFIVGLAMTLATGV